MSIKIGDKVRFLSEVGGGIVTGFARNEQGIVEGEDGFEVIVSEIPKGVCKIRFINSY